MTLIDLIKFGIIKSDAAAEKFAADLIDCWHDDKIPGELLEVLGALAARIPGVDRRGVSLLTIAHWQHTSHPPLDVSQPWFKLGGKPPHEKVGYLAARKAKLNGHRHRMGA